MGKHLLSHYHCRVSGVLVNPRNPSVRRFLLEHIANVVRQSPFQCAPCHFYCNTEETFLLHWRSDLHSKTVEQVSGSLVNQSEMLRIFRVKIRIGVSASMTRIMHAYDSCTCRRVITQRTLNRWKTDLIDSCTRTFGCANFLSFFFFFLFLLRLAVVADALRATSGAQTTRQWNLTF